MCLYSDNKLINNLPENIEKIYIIFYDDDDYNKNINLPITLKEIVIEKEEFKKYLKIPFGTIVSIKKIK